jgi:hypothetical protein
MQQRRSANAPEAHEGIGQFGTQHAGEEVGLPEADNDNTQNEQPHCGEKMSSARSLRGEDTVEATSHLLIIGLLKSGEFHITEIVEHASRE